MAVSFRDKAQVFGTTTATAVTIPATVQAGDLLILQAVGGWTPTVPSGWTTEYSFSSTNIGSFVAYKTATVGDSGATITVAWNSAYNHVVNLIAVAGGQAIRTPASHLWSSNGGTGAPAAQSAAAGDMAIYLGGNRQGGGAPALSRGTIDQSGVDSSTIAGGVIGHELLAADMQLSCTFTSPLNGSGYEYSVLLVSGGGEPVTTRQMSRQSLLVLANDLNTNATMSRHSVAVITNDQKPSSISSRMSLQVLIPTAPRFRGWGLDQ
jgi:hypothetical protein